ncbi:hypothetical protein BC936DRAFT_140827 [Jimgerdemannia flammicorona]|uniref:Uncharacterized protein n=1 Tax=Jimgerdemannia flammicorona TaxID=994334 RepID=A0A433A3G1_9FUNG|nr:hypothetical protein BC936DRAFT_140827 [Jimgerdemannia flammicorona]
MSTFKCKFDENLLGFVERLKDYGHLFHWNTITANYNIYFADDISHENIRGADDAAVVVAATTAERTLITNDTDLFFTAGDNTYGVIVLWGGIVENEVYKEFRSFRKREKREAVQLLFGNRAYLREMERIRREKTRELALLEQQENGMIWTFRPPSKTESDGFLTKKIEKTLKKVSKALYNETNQNNDN